MDVRGLAFRTVGLALKFGAWVAVPVGAVLAWGAIENAMDKDKGERKDHVRS